MTWTEPLNFPTSYAGIEFLIRDTIKGNSKRDLVENKIPYRPGSTFEDMSRGPYRCSFVAIFTGENATANAKEFFDLINQDDASPEVFVHPLWGDITGWIESQDDEIDCTVEDYVELSLSFVEDNAAFDQLQEAQKQTIESSNNDLSGEIDNATILMTDQLESAGYTSDLATAQTDFPELF